MSYDELRRATEELRALRPGVVDALRRMPGFRGVGIGVQQRRGILTGEPAFRIYFDVKRPLSMLSRRERVPASFFGFPTDVHALSRGRAECCNGTRPLLGGLKISARPTDTQGSDGTLGCFITSQGKFLGLTNQHVVGSVVSHPQIFQPQSKSCFGECNEIGASSDDFKAIGDVPFSGDDYWVDCAGIVLSKVDFKSALVTVANEPAGATAVTLPSGVPGSVKVNSKGLVTEIRDGSDTLVDTTKITTTATPVINTLVWKIGAATQLTVGVVTVADGLATFEDRPLNVVNAKHQITVEPVAGFHVTDTQLAFSREGDSGAVYMDLQNRVVGLHHHGSSGGGAALLSHGSQIGAVLSALNATLVADGGTSHQTLAESNALARELWAKTPVEAHDLTALENEVRARVSRSPLGRKALELVEAHAAEVLRLVWHLRAVTVVWHRHHGPAFIVLFARALARAGSTFPEVAGGVSRASLVDAMADALAAHGSPALRSDLEAARPWLRDILAMSRNLEELCERLAEQAA